MGVIETEYTEIREITKGVLNGTISKEVAAIALKGYSESGKRVDQYLKIVSMTINHGKAAKSIINKNLISDSTAIDMGTIEEKVKCEEQGSKLITRCECLDYSGLAHNIDKCQKCEQFTITRKQF